MFDETKTNQLLACRYTNPKLSEQHTAIGKKGERSYWMLEEWRLWRSELFDDLYFGFALSQHRGIVQYSKAFAVVHIVALQGIIF